MEIPSSHAEVAAELKVNLGDKVSKGTPLLPFHCFPRWCSDGREQSNTSTAILDFSSGGRLGWSGSSLACCRRREP